MATRSDPLKGGGRAMLSADLMLRQYFMDLLQLTPRQVSEA